MIRDITIGQYYQTKSVIHELDPRVKLMGTLVFIISLFLGKSVWMYLAVTAFLACNNQAFKCSAEIHCKRS